jgi:hypothetical protein
MGALMNRSPQEVVRQMRIDMTVYDREGQIVLVAEIQGTPAMASALGRLGRFLNTMDQPGAFGMLVDPEKIVILGRDVENPRAPVCTLNAADVLRHYFAEFGTKRVSRSLLQTLVAVWLDDLTNHWKYEKPPASDVLASIGLLPMLEGGRVKEEVVLRDDPLP